MIESYVRWSPSRFCDSANFQRKTKSEMIKKNHLVGMLPFMCTTYAAKHTNKSFEPWISKKVKNLCRKLNEFFELCLMLVFRIGNSFAWVRAIYWSLSTFKNVLFEGNNQLTDSNWLSKNSVWRCWCCWYWDFAVTVVFVVVVIIFKANKMYRRRKNSIEFSN